MRGRSAFVFPGFTGTLATSGSPSINGTTSSGLAPLNSGTVPTRIWASIIYAQIAVLRAHHTLHLGRLPSNPPIAFCQLTVHPLEIPPASKENFPLSLPATAPKSKSPIRIIASSCFHCNLIAHACFHFHNPGSRYGLPTMPAVLSPRLPPRLTVASPWAACVDGKPGRILQNTSKSE